MAKRLKFIVEIDQPEDATQAEVRNYILNAVSRWYGQLDPTDPLWKIGKTVTVKRYQHHSETKKQK